MTAPVTNATDVGKLENHGIYLFTKVVTPDSCADAIRYILESNLNSKNYNKIQLIINTPGGDLPAAFALCDVMQGSKIPIYTIGLGLIASAGLLIFMAGKRGHRNVTTNTMLLSHQWTGGSVGKEHELLASVKAYEIMQKNMLAHYKKFTKLSESNIKKYLLPPNDVWITPKDAIALKIVDNIIEPSAQIREVIS